MSKLYSALVKGFEGLVNDYLFLNSTFVFDYLQSRYDEVLQNPNISHINMLGGNYFFFDLCVNEYV